MSRVVACRGFGLLEAIVAMTILAGTGAALYTWVGSNLRAVSQFAEARARAQLQLQALEMLEAINPAAQAVGARKLGQLEVSWRSEPASLLRPGISRGDGARWQVGLYRVNLLVRDVSSGTEVRFDTLHTGVLPLGAAAPPLGSDKP